jgi:hypothetical protein
VLKSRRSRVIDLTEENRAAGGQAALIALRSIVRRALDVTPGDLLELIDDPPKPKRRSKKKMRG